MKKFLLSEDEKDFTIKLLIFYILNLLDILFTQYVLFNASDIFQECNFIMAPIVTNVSGLLIKVIVPLILIIYWKIRIKKASEKQFTFSDKALNYIVIAFVIINLIHISNIALYVYLL